MANPRFEEDEDKDALFVVNPADAAVDGVGRPLSERPNRDQPSPVKTDFQAFGMPAPGEDDGNQGNPLAEGVIMGKDGERPWKKGDNFMGSTKQSDLIDERTNMQPPLFFSAKELPEDPEFDAEDMEVVDPDDLPEERKDRKLDAIATSVPPQSAPAGGGASRPPGAMPAAPNSSETAPVQGVCPKCGQQEPCACYTDPMSAGNGPGDVAGVKQADVQKESIAPALALLGGGLLRAAAPALLRGAMGAGAGGGAGLAGTVGRGLLMGGGMQAGMGAAEKLMGGGEQQPMQQQVFQPQTAEHFGSEYESPSSKPFPKDTDAEDVDQKEYDDGEREPLQVGIDVNGVGGTDSIHGLSDNLFDSFQGLLPKILDFYGSEDAGEQDADLSELAKKFDEEMPDWHNSDDKHAVKFITVLMDQNPEQKTALNQPNLNPMNGPTTLRPEDIKNNAPAMSDRCYKCGGTIDPSDNSCPQCGAMMGNAIHQGKTAEQLQGPQNDEQKALVAQFLQESGREDEIPSMILEPFKYAEELAEVIGRDAPPEGTGDPEPAIEEAPPAETMPVPNMQVPQNPQQAMANVIKRAEENHLQEHGDNFDNSIGVSPAEEIEVEDSSKEQDSGHTWTDENGDPLKVGQEYEMFSANYDIPDMIRIEAVKPDSIEYTLTGEYGLEHRTEISREESLLEQLSFAPATQTHPDDIQSPAERDPGLEENMEDVGRPTVGVDQTDLSRPHSVMGSSESSRDWLKEGGAKFTPMEQRDFIEEAGVARNADKLDLSGTHYEARVEVDDDFFLFGL